MQSSFIKSRGFTMLEIVIAIMIVSAMTVMLSSAFSPFMLFSKRMTTEERLNHLLKATETMYRAKAYVLDSNDDSSLDTHSAMSALGAMRTGPNPQDLMSTACQTKSTAGGQSDRDSADTLFAVAGTATQQQNLKALQPFTELPLSELSKDGHGNVVCVLVSKRANMVHEGYLLHYHVVAFVSAGGNNYVEPDTKLVVENTVAGVPVWKLQLAGDDKGVVFDGSKVVLQNFQLTKERLTRFARAYESYFKIRYQSLIDKVPNKNYFYANAPAWGTAFNGEPTPGVDNPDPDAVFSYYNPGLMNLAWLSNPNNLGTMSPLAPATLQQALAGASNNTTVVSNYGAGYPGLARVLGMTDNDVLDAWGHVILIDNASNRVRTGGNGRYPPYTAQFGAILPGGEGCGDINNPNTICPYYMTVTAASTY